MLVDIACNITSEQFKDHKEVIDRARESRTIPLFVGVDYKSTLKCIQLAKEYKTLCYAGLHPTHSEENEKDIEKIQELIKEPVVVAVGECGLDYCRTEFANIDYQKKAFIAQLELKASKYFLHSRESHRDFMEIISDFNFSGVVHSFTGTVEEASEIVKKGLYIGINGCSLKSEEGIEVVKNIPEDKLLIETDAPYCKIRKSYAGFKFISPRKEIKILRKRNEPCCLEQVLEAISKIREVQKEDLESSILKNSIEFYGEKLEKVISDFF